ncbi:Poly(ADP-ribose) polymerase catalytic domain protein, partial [Necator americanus]
FGRTPLHYAFASREQLLKGAFADALRDPIAVVSILARNMTKQQLDLADCDGNTVLHLAAFKNANICAVTLIRKGASVTIKNKDGNTPLAVAVLHGRQAVALTLIQAESNVTEQVFPPKSAQLEVELWKWAGAKEQKDEVKVSTIPAQIIAKGGGWEAMVYVLMDALGTNLTSLVQMIDASLKECQYNLANQLTKSLQARLLGKKLPKSEYDLLLTFAQHFRGDLAEDGVEYAVLNRLYALGSEVITDGVSRPLEAVVLNGKWPLYLHFKARAGKAWTGLRPSQPTMGPLRNAVLRASKGRDDFADGVIRELAALPHFSSLLGKGRKRKASESENDERAESEDGSEGGAESNRSVGDADADEEQDGNEQERRTPPPKKTKIYNKKLDLMASDKKGKNILHYMVEPIQWENTDLLGQLHKEAPAKIKQLLQEKNKDGNTPLDIAMKTKQRKFAAAIRSILGSAAKKAKISNGIGSDLPDVSDLACRYNVNEDSKMFIEQWQVENEMDSEPETPKPSSLSGYSETAELVRCPVTNQFMAGVLNKTDLNYGRYGFHNFYRIELMKRRDTDLWILFTNWGRIGQGVGEYQTTPFSNMDTAMKEFKTVWRSKTGQDWGPLDKFQMLPKKYRLVETTKRISNMSEITISCKERKEEDMIRRTIQDISNPEKLKDYAKQICWNIKCPFGHVTEAAIERARAVLDQCEQNVQDLEKTLQKEGHTDMDRELSGEFYQNLPVGDFEYGAVTVFDNIEEINRTRGALNQLTEVEVATRLLTASAHRADIDRISYISAALECRFTEMSPSDNMSQKILRYIHSTGGAGEKIKGILEVSPRKATLNFEKFVDDENQRFLWHGTKAVNLLSILKDGFLVDPRNTSITGRLFGDIEEINRTRGALNQLTEVEVATRLLTASAHRADIDRISYISAALECRFTEMSPSDNMSQKILRYIHSTGGAGEKIKGILEVSPRKATLNFEKFVDDENQRFLWHGTKAVNLLSILKDGFLVDPRNTSITGRLFGDGVYLADAFEKSTHYCQTSAKNYRYMILCRVALGKNYVLKSWDYSYNDQMPAGYDSLQVIGQKYPKTSITINGVAMPLCDFGDHSSNRYSALEFSEYIVRDSARVLPQYLVIFQ